MENESDLRRRYKTLFKHLDERQRRLLVAADAKQLDRGGISMVARASGLSRPTIYKGLQELQEKPLGRVRRDGGGRKYIEESDPTILRRLEELIAPATRGDPMSPLRWTSKSTRHLEQTLNQEGYEVSRATVALLLCELGYSLQGASKTLEGKQHPDRNAQFEYINKMTNRFFRKGDPVISVDAKKKELVGNGNQRGSQMKSWSTIFLIKFLEKPFRTESMIFGRMLVGSMLEQTMIQQALLWRASVAGGGGWANRYMKMLKHCSFAQMAAAAIATARAYGRSNCNNYPMN
jgi:DNA-binding transcriptional ArsR family regulator